MTTKEGRPSVGCTPAAPPPSAWEDRARILALELPPARSPKQRTNNVVSLGGIQLPNTNSLVVSGTGQLESWPRGNSRGLAR